MLLFSRVVTLTGSPRRVTPWAMEITEYVRSHSDLNVSLWQGTFGYPLGTFIWSVPVESQAALADGTAKLLTDDGYYDLLEKGAEFVGQPGQDLLRDVVYGGPQAGGEPPAVGSVGVVTTAIALVDRIADAVGWSVDIAQHVSGVTGAPVAVLTNAFGQMGQITWIGIQPDIASAEAAGAKISGDADYLGRLPATKDLFVPASGHTSQVVRLA